MNYIKMYFITHVKYWWVYLISLITLFIGIVASLLFASFLSNWGVADIVVWIIAIIIGSAIGSIPLIYTNYMVALTYTYGNTKKFKKYMLTVCNHFITYIIYLALYYIIVTNLN